MQDFLIELLYAIAPISREWDGLADRLRAAPFMRAGWFESWYAAFAGGAPPIVLAAREGSRLVGVLPLRQRAGGLTSPTNGHTPGFAVLADGEAAAHALAAAVLRLAHRRLQLDFVDDGDRGVAAIAHEARRASRRVLHVGIRRSPYVPLRDGVEWRLKAKVAADLRRRHRRLAATAPVELEVADGSERLDALLEEGFRLEASGWKAGRGTAIVSSESTRRFYTELAHWAAARGLLRLAFLRRGGCGVAFHYALQDRDAYYLLKGGYDPALRTLAPGKLLTRAMVSRAAAEGLERFEFLGAEEPWKLEWRPEFHERTLLRVFAPTTLGVADGAAQAAYLRYARPLAKRAVARLR